jgi:hypothetical protein
MLDLDTIVLIGLVVVIATIRVVMVVGQIPFAKDLNIAAFPTHFNKEKGWADLFFNEGFQPCLSHLLKSKYLGF